MGKEALGFLADVLSWDENLLWIPSCILKDALVGGASTGFSPCPLPHQGCLFALEVTVLKRCSQMVTVEGTYVTHCSDGNFLRTGWHTSASQSSESWWKDCDFSCGTQQHLWKRSGVCAPCGAPASWGLEKGASPSVLSKTRAEAPLSLPLDSLVTVHRVVCWWCICWRIRAISVLGTIRSKLKIYNL